MTTLRQIDKLWANKQFGRMLRELSVGRPEGMAQGVLAGVQLPVAAAAMAIARLVELGQGHQPLCAVLIRSVITQQDADGGWTDPASTALALRALRLSGGDGVSVHAGLRYLTMLQKPDGTWPSAPIRRMPSSPVVSAFIALLLGDDAAFHEHADVARLCDWFGQNESNLDAETARLWSMARQRIRRGASTNRFSSSAAMLS